VFCHRWIVCCSALCHKCALSVCGVQTIDKMGYGGVMGQIAGVVDKVDNTMDGVR